MGPYRKCLDKLVSLKAGIALGSVLLLVFAGAGPARAQTRNVDCGAGETIANALQGRPGTLTLIITGVCNENVTVTRDDVTLVAGAGGGTVNGADPSADTITVSADRVRIDGLEVTGGNSGINAIGAGNLKIENCDVHNAGRYGILIGGGSKATIHDCTVQSNGRIGIAISGSAAATVTSSTISSNTRDGILILGGYGQIGVNDRFDAALGNTISNNGGPGITVLTGGSAQLVANTISGNGTDPAQARFGISVGQASANIHGGNTITGNNGHGVSVNASSVSIGGTAVATIVGLPVVTISGNGTAVANSSGVRGFNGASIAITQTTISGTLNNGRGITLDLQSRVSLFGSNVQVVNNTLDGIAVSTGSAVFFGTPVGTPATVTGNGGFGLNCAGSESSFSGDTSGIALNTAGQISGTCTGF